MPDLRSLLLLPILLSFTPLWAASPTGNINIQSPLTSAQVANSFTLSGICDKRKLIEVSGDLLNPTTELICPESQYYEYQVIVTAGSGVKNISVQQLLKNNFAIQATASFNYQEPELNLRPNATDDNVTGTEDQTISIDVLSNDTDPNGDVLRLTAVGSASHGEVVIASDSNISYQPHANFHGSDSFSYEVSDGECRHNVAMVNITVNPVNDLPVAAEDSFEAMQNMTFTGTSVLMNDSDIDGDVLLVSALAPDTNQGGNVNINSDGSFSYTPPTDFVGEDTFTYDLSDGQGGQTQGLVRLNVVAHSDAGSDDPEVDNSNPHETGSAKNNEHAAVLAMVDPVHATHVAVASGSWFSTMTWNTGSVPSNGAKVLIPLSIEVNYDQVSDVRLSWVRVDGGLRFATTQSSKMIVDTLVATMSSQFSMGSEVNPVEANVKAEIIITNNGPIDVDWDPILISRGVILHGTSTMHGEIKTTHLKVDKDPMAGDTMIVLEQTPVNWKPGDTIVVAGTRYKGYTWDNDARMTRHFLPEDDVLTIDRVEGYIAYVTSPLRFDHPRMREDMKTSVANYSRNVRIATEEPSTAAVSERGHFMLMHSDKADIRYSEFFELGRTDKSQPAIDVFELESVTSESNIQGRYALHFHRTGMKNVRKPAIAVGNAVFGSPGWGYVHHDSNVHLIDNASYNTFGAGFVAETGNEIGLWKNNIAIYAKGVGWGNPKNFVDLSIYDIGKTGDGFWFQGRMVRAIKNIAASVNAGFAYFHRDRGYPDYRMIRFDAKYFDFPEAVGEGKLASPNHAPILSFIDNETFAANFGLHVVKANPNQQHDIHSHLKRLKAWSVRNGAHLEYTSHYLLEDFDLLAKLAQDFSRPNVGLAMGSNTSDMIIKNPKISGFKYGTKLSKKFTEATITPEKNQYVIIDPEIVNSIEMDFFEFDPSVDKILTSDDLLENTMDIELTRELLYRDRLSADDREGRKVIVEGVKTDRIGLVPIPAGTDNYFIDRRDMLHILETDGYFQASDGTYYTLLEMYFSERFSGEVEKFTFPVRLDQSIVDLLGYPWWGYGDAVFKGPIDFNNQAPVVGNDSGITPMNQELTLNLLNNDSDPEGDWIKVDGIVQPENGRVFDNGDGTVTYQPDLGFSGTEIFHYWTTDGYGNYSKASVRIQVSQ